MKIGSGVITVPRMNRLIASFLVFVMALPVVLPWMPHDAVHALHNQQVWHGGANSSTHLAHQHTIEHSHTRTAEDFQASSHHAIDLNAVTYFDEYLLVDFAKAKQVVSLQSGKAKQGAGLNRPQPNTVPPAFVEATIQNRAPPAWQTLQRPPYTPVYLTTQRLRI